MNDEYQMRQHFGNCDSTEITQSHIGYWKVTNCPMFGPKFILVITKSKYYGYNDIINSPINNIQVGKIVFKCGQ